MKRILILAGYLLFLVLLTGNLFAQAPAAQDAAQAASTPSDKPSPPPRPRFVPVLLSVTDGSGNPVTGLTKDQLTIMDANQVVQPLQVYKAADIPLHLGIVLLSSDASFGQQQAAAIDLVQKVIRSSIDSAFVIAARGKKPWASDRLEWKQDPAELVKIIQGLDRNAGLPDAFHFDMQTAETTADESAGRMTLQTYAGTGVTVFDAVYSMINSDPRPARRVLVMFREPWGHSPGIGLRPNTAVEAQVLRVISIAQEMHISTFVIGLEDPKFNRITDNNIGKNYISLHGGDDNGAGSANREYDREMERTRMRAYDAGKTNIQRIAAETGGMTLWSTKKNYSDAVNTIANQLAGQYIATFAPTDAAGPMHTLKVTTSGGAHVLAQTKYLYGAPQ